jgi:polyisoprenoid-binding protein YceI
MHHFHVSDPMGRNSVSFTSEAPLEDIVGTSREISGYLVFDPQNPTHDSHGELRVPVASLNTGIPLRDEHLQGKDWLDADGYPDIVLVIDKVADIKVIEKTADYQTYDLNIQGELTIHGHTQKVKIPGRLTYLMASDKTRQVMPGDLLAARADFDVALADFGVTGPRGAGIVGSKVGESISINVSFRATNASQQMADNPCGGKASSASNPCGGKATTTQAASAANPCGGKAMNPCGGK